MLLNLEKHYIASPNYTVLRHLTFLSITRRLNQGDPLKPNTILVIPMEASASDTSPLPETPKEDTVVKQVEEEQDQQYSTAIQNTSCSKKGDHLWDIKNDMR